MSSSSIDRPEKNTRQQHPVHLDVDRIDDINVDPASTLSGQGEFSRSTLLSPPSTFYNSTTALASEEGSGKISSNGRRDESSLTQITPERLVSQDFRSSLADESPTRTMLFSRRRCLQEKGHGTVPSPASSTTTTTTATTTSTSLRLRNSSAGRASTIVEEEEEDNTTGAGGRGVRASLDAGMARVRRWIRSRSSSTAATSSTAQAGTTTYSWANPSAASPLRAQRPEDAYTSQDEEEIEEEDDLLDQDYFNDDGESGFRGRLTQPNILEEETYYISRHQHRSARQRALSEPDGVRIRDLLFQRALSAPLRAGRGRARRRYPTTSTHTPQQQLLRRSRCRERGNSAEFVTTSSSQLSSSAAEVLYASSRSLRSGLDQSQVDLDEAVGDAEISTAEISARQGSRTVLPRTSNSGNRPNQADSDQDDPHRLARSRWIRINRRFQVVITIVAMLFSLLLFAILVCWVVLTSSYVVSIDKSCDVPLKIYYWLVTLQLIMDVFRTDIMRLFFRWDANSNQRIPCRVITYNVGYLTYALLVLRMGIHSVFLNDDETTCHLTAPGLFQSSAAFISLSIAAWSTILFGYLAPFCVVATMLTLNGYAPTSDNQRDGATGPFTVFPSSMGAPQGCVDELPIVMLEDFPAHYPMECCICMDNFTGTDVIVRTGCHHVFHKECCRGWLRQARTCPVCRTDIPTSLEENGQNQGRSAVARLGFGSSSSHFVARNDIHHEVVSLLQILRRRDRRNRQPASSENRAQSSTERRDGGSHGPIRPIAMREMSSNLEEGHSVAP